MATNRCVKRSKKSRAVFESAADNSFDLNFIISQDRISQTGLGFEEFANSINNGDIKRKIKNLLFLMQLFFISNRHCVHEFSQHSDESISTIWFLNNKNSIKKIECNLVIESWAKQISSDTFKK